MLRPSPQGWVHGVSCQRITPLLPALPGDSDRLLLNIPENQQQHRIVVDYPMFSNHG